MCEVQGRAELQKKEKVSKCCEEIFGWPKIVAKEGVCVRVRPSGCICVCSFSVTGRTWQVMCKNSWFPVVHHDGKVQVSRQAVPFGEQEARVGAVRGRAQHPGQRLQQR